jgi:hypothetical protein
MAVYAKYCFETLYPYGSALSSAEQQTMFNPELQEGKHWTLQRLLKVKKG